MKENVPLVVPEVNGEDIRDNEGIIANPNCCAIPLTMVVDPIRREVGIERLVVATYQSASGAGKDLVKELAEQTRAIAEGRQPVASVYPYQLAYNVVPGGWRPDADGYNEEEVKIVNETRKILQDPALRLVATCVRVPVPVGHGEAVFIETSRPLSPGSCSRAPSRRAWDQRSRTTPRAGLPDPGRDGRHRRGLRRPDPARPLGRSGLALWLVSDNLRKGAALNAVQIAEQAIEMGVMS